MPTRLLIAEDDRSVADMIAFGVRMTWPGCEIDIAANGEDALRIFRDERPNLVVLDISIPPPDGFEVCREIRRTSKVPIMMLTGRHSTIDKVRALDLGADDYLTKPFDHIELLARLRALARRAGFTGRIPHSQTVEASDHNLVVGDLSIDTHTHRVSRSGEVVQLTSTEYRLLEELMRNAGTVLPHSLLIERVWGPEYAGEAHYLKVFVRRLRSKLGDNSREPKYIQNEWGIGYRFIS